MTALFDVARDEILGRFKTQWDADTPAVNGTVIPTIFYEGINTLGDQPHDAAWAQIFIRHNDAFQRTLGPAGSRRFTKLGIVTVQIFVPLETGVGLTLMEALAKIAEDAFEGKTTINNIWFRNVRIIEVGVEGPWYQANVLADFEYDSLG